MARTGFFHHVGTFLLFAAMVLLIVTTISAPVVNDLAILEVDRAGDSDAKVTFGTFGYCLKNINGSGWACSPRVVGYSPTDVMSSVDGTSYSSYSQSTTKALTKAMILHPISCGLNFIAFVLALGAGVVGSFLASLVALLAFVVTVVVMIIDFVLFTILRDNVNDDTSDNAHYGPAAWTVLVSAICSLLGTIIVFLTCCSARIHRRHSVSKAEIHNGDGAVPRRRGWW